MTGKLRYLGISGVALLLCAVVFMGVVLHPRADATSVNVFDYGLSSTESNEAMSAAELFEKLLGQPPTASELAYLNEKTEFSLLYNAAIPAHVVTDYNGDLGILKVTASPYTYTAQNGAVVEWVPIAARVGEVKKTLELANGERSCLFENLYHSDDFEMTIDYSWEVSIPKEHAESLLGAPYAAAVAASNASRDYAERMQEYGQLLEKYLVYEAYVESVKAYEKYINVDLPAYERAVEEYRPYAEYLERLAAYEAWQQYWAYQEFMTGDVQEKYRAYQAYLEQLKPIRARLNILETLYIKDSHGWQLYASLMGGTVEQVVDRKDELISYKKEFEKWINNAQQSTQVLKKLMSEYAELRQAKYASEHEKLTTLYAFYTKNYQTLTANYAQLYQALNTMGGDSVVTMALSEKGKLERYYQFVGQLYVTWACLDDSVTLSAKEGICAAYFLNEVVEPIHLLTDSGASPNGIMMPAVEVPKVEKVEQIEQPTVPEVSKKPKWYGSVPEAPVVPTEISKPDTSNPPAVAENPGPAPVAPALTAGERLLMEDLNAGRLSKRTASKESYSLAFDTTVATSVSIRNLKTVTFYSADGKTVLDRQTVHYGERVTYQGPDTARESDEKSHYQFLCWVTLPDRTETDLVAYSNMSVYAHYLEKPRFYTVTWILDGKTESKNLQYGADPNLFCPFVTNKDPDRVYTYTFSGWDREVLPVSGDVTYTGSMQKELRNYQVTWVLGDRIETVELPYGSYPLYAGDTSRAPDDYRYEFSGWDAPLMAVERDVTYTAEYRRVALATDRSGSVLNVTQSEDALTVFAIGDRSDIREAAVLAKQQGKALELCLEKFSIRIEADDLDTLLNSYCRQIGIVKETKEDTATVYEVGYLNSAGRPLNLGVVASVTMRENDEDGTYVGRLSKADGWSVLEDGQGEAVGGFVLRVSDVYHVGITSTEPCNLLYFTGFFESGAEVDLSVIGCVFGYEITGATLLLDDGSRSPIQNLCFVMPDRAVEVELTITKIIYRVSFTVDGVVIHTAQYGAGEEILPPEDPTKETDGHFFYTFSAWSPEVGVALGDERELIFEAVFSTTPVGREFVPDRSLFYTVLVIGIVGVLLLIGGTVTLILLLRRRKRKLTAAQKELPAVKESTTESESSSDL